jgi:subtilisin family serine protease
MSRLTSASIAVLAAASLVACSEAPISPDGGPSAPETVLFGVNQGGREQVMAGEVIVKLRDVADANAVANAHGLAAGEHGYRDAFVIMRGATGAEHANANSLKNDERVEYAEPNYLRQIDVDPKLWAFRNPGGLNMTYSRGQTKGQPLGSSYASTSDADEDNIDGYAAGGSPVKIGSIDTGVDFTHPELAGKLIAGNDWYSNDNDPSDTDGHGTHTTGTMVGSTVGVAGVAGAGANVQVYVQRVCGQRGCPTSAIVSAIRAAADFGVVAMNLSLGGGSISQAERDAIAYANAGNALVIASAGNGGTGTVSCPACDAGAISVAATNWKDALTYYSNWGSGLDISAPGGECYSNTSAEGCIYSSYKGGGYAYLQGTSMAAPQVTGTAGIVASKNASLRGGSLRSRLLGTTDNIGDATHFGSGRLNSYRAVTNSSLGAGL